MSGRSIFTNQACLAHSLGKADEPIILFREILEKGNTNQQQPARETQKKGRASCNIQSCGLPAHRDFTFSYHTAVFQRPERFAPVLETVLLPDAMGCGASQQPVPYVVNSTKNEVDEQLAKMQEDERHHYKVNRS